MVLDNAVVAQVHPMPPALLEAPQQQHPLTLSIKPSVSVLSVHFAGISMVRATRNANNNLQLISVSRFLCAESDLSVSAHIKAEIALLGLDALNFKAQRTTLSTATRCPSPSLALLMQCTHLKPSVMRVCALQTLCDSDGCTSVPLSPGCVHFRPCVTQIGALENPFLPNACTSL